MAAVFFPQPAANCGKLSATPVLPIRIAVCVSGLLDVLVILSSVSLMLVYSLRLSLIVLAALPLYIGLTAFFTPLLRRLHDAGYAGWLVVEAEQDPRKAHPLTYARLGYRNLRSMAEQAGLLVV